MSECAYWNPSDCVGAPECPPRCPRFIDKHGRALSIRGYRARDRTALETMYRSYDTAHKSLWLSVERTNRRAVAVYRRLGFETVESKGSEMRMRLQLSAPATGQLRSVQ